MKITKYSHACLVVEKDNEALVIDPGVFSNDLVVPNNVVAVVVTHEHADHFDEDKLTAIINQNPDAVIYAHENIISTLARLPAEAVDAGHTVYVGNFALGFSGGEHALIHESMPRIPNLAVTVDEMLFYPGDSFTQPDAGTHIQLLALPISAPWMKLAEAMDYLAAVKPGRAFPTHDAILSETGQTMVDGMLGTLAERVGTRYARIQLAEALEI